MNQFLTDDGSSGDSAGDGESDNDQPDDPQGEDGAVNDDDNDAPYGVDDGDKRGKCQRLIRSCCCCPCRNIARCCKRMGHLFKRIFCTGNVLKSVPFKFVIAAIFISLIQECADTYAQLSKLSCWLS